MKQEYTELLENKGIFIFNEDKKKSDNKAILFPGHGAQYVNMLKKLYKKYPIVAQILDRADVVYNTLEGCKLTDKIFADDDNDEAAKKRIVEPRVMQPAIYTANMALYELIKSFGITADYLVGHSLGELSALSAAGAFTFEDGLRMAYYRACAVEGIPVDKRGGMVSVGLKYDKETAARLIAGYEDVCEVSIINSHKQFNISGTVEAVKAIKSKCEKENISASVLMVSHAFHSRIMRPSVEPYRRSLESFKFDMPEIPVYSTITQRFYEEKDLDTNTMAQILSSQLVTPFSFSGVIEDLAVKHNTGVFIEAGPSNILTKLVMDILDRKQYIILNTNSRKQDDELVVEYFRAQAVINQIAGNKTDKNKVMNSFANRVNENSIEEASTLDNKLIKIISAETMYPESAVEINNIPMKKALAATDSINSKIFDRIEKEFGIVLDSKQRDSISSAELLKMIKKDDDISERDGLTNENAVVCGCDKNEIHEFILGIIQDKTGYPKEMLEDDLDLEADLGIDSVKQGEIFGRIREKYQYTVGENENIKEYSTINKIVEYTLGKVGSSVSGSTQDAENAAQAPDGTSAEEIREFLLEVIGDKTGYPKEMLEDDLDLEADLGIDSVKQGEIFGRIREKYQYTVGENENIKEYSTINKIVEYTLGKVGDGSDKQTSSGSEGDSSAAEDSEGIGEYASEASRAEADKEKEKIIKEKISKICENKNSNRYIAVAVEKALDKKNGTVYDFSDKNVLLISDDMGGRITEAVFKKLAGKSKSVTILAENAVQAKGDIILTDFSDSDKIKVAMEEAAKKASIDAVVNLYSISEQFQLEDIAPDKWKRKVDSNYNINFYCTKAVYSNFENEKERCAYFAVTNIGGVYGIEKTDKSNPFGAITSGFVKALEKELRPFKCKVIDFTDVTDIDKISDKIIEECSLIEDLVEVAYVNKRRKVIQVIPKEIDMSRAQFKEVCNDDVVLVTGGSRGIIYKCVTTLLDICNPKVIITGRTALPDANEKWVKMSDKEFDDYKSEFLVEAKKENSKATLLELNFAYEKKRNARELLANLKELSDKGYSVEYRKCDAANTDEVKALVQEVVKKYGKITGVLNGAGLPSFGKIPKKAEKFAEEVVRVKANSFYALYNACIGQPLKFFVCMGSITGRFGMDGQVDYAAAADIIVRLSFQQAYKSDSCKYTVMGWSAWDEVGMAANEQVKKVQQEQRGLEYIAANEGAQRFVEELVYGSNYPEALFFGSLGDINLPLGQLNSLTRDLKHIMNVCDTEGNLIDRTRFPLVDKVVSYTKDSIVATKYLNVNGDIHLKDHLVEGKHVFAGVMHVEAASELLDAYLELNKLSGYRMSSIEGFEFKKFIKVFEGDGLELRYYGEIVEDTPDEKKIKVTIKSDFINKKGMVLEKDRIHSFGYVTATNKAKEIRKTDKEVKALLANSKKLNIQKYYDNSYGFITFGKSFRCIENVGYVNEKIIVGSFYVPDDGNYFSFTKYAETIISPVSVDNMGRFMLFNDFHKNGYSIVPVIFTKAKKNRNFTVGEKLYVFCELTKEGGNKVVYSAYVVDDDNNVVFEVEDMVMERINRYDGDSSLY